MMKYMKMLFVTIWFAISLIPVTGKESSDADKIYEKMAETLSKVENKLQNKTIAIYGFEVIGRKDDSYGKFATEKLTHYIVKKGDLTVIERSRIDQILKEQSLSMTGTIDAGTAAKIGRILAVDAVVIGTIHVTDKEVEFIARVIQSEKGIILASTDEKLTTGISAEDNTGNNQQGNEIIEDIKDRMAEIRLNKKIYSKTEHITITYSDLPGNQNDWITLVKESEPDTVYGDWFYTYGQKSGSYTFKIAEPGDYEVRVYYDWPNGGYVVQKRIKIKVK